MSNLNDFIGIEKEEKILLFDASNVLYRTFHANKANDEKTISGLAHHAALTTLNKYYKQFKPDKVVMAFDRSNWRKQYTKTDACLSGKLYKGNRRTKFTPKEQEKYEAFCEHILEFENLLRDHTSIICLSANTLEADDLMAGIVQHYRNKKDNSTFTIVSQDRDLLQLLKFQNVTIMDPATGKARTLEEYDNDVKWFMFQKCIRGDLGDNVGSALPKVRTTRLKLAFSDPYEYEKLMNETWTNQEEKVFKVKDLYDENKLLMDLESQPTEIRNLIEETIVHGLENPGKYSDFHFRKHCGKYELKMIADGINQYINMLSS
jgi:hypothetical protein